MSFGLKNAPAYSQSLMDMVLGGLRNECAIAYLDDIIIFSDSPVQHLKDIEEIFKALQKANLSMNKLKSVFGLPSVEYLGFTISAAGMQASPEKIKPILTIKQPSNLKELERVLGLFGVYQRFIGQFKIIAEPLRRLKKKHTAYIWGAELAFDQIKHSIANYKQFELHVDAVAATAGIGMVHCQRFNGHPYPLSFASRSLNIHEQKYAIREIEEPCLGNQET